MQFLRTLFWVLLAVLGVVFALNNWSYVSLRLWAGLTADVVLPLLLLITFLAGFLPMLLLYQTTRWRLRARLASAERSLAELRAPAPAPAPAPVIDPVPMVLTKSDEPLPPPMAVPVAVPPGVI